MSTACRYCSAPMSASAPVCLACGRMAGTESVTECENHPTEAAIAVCSLCGKPVCGDCAGSVEERFFCENREHREVYKDWPVVAEAESGFEAAMISRNLEQAGWSVRVFDPHRYLVIFWENAPHRVAVRVHRSRAAEAMDLLQTLQLAGTNKETGG